MSRVTTDQRVQTICLLVLAACAGAGLLFYFQSVMIPFTLAVFATLAINPVVNFICSKIPVPRIVAIIAVFLLGSLAFPVVGAVVTASVAELAANAGVYQTQLTEVTVRVVERLPFEALGISGTDIQAQVANLPVGTYVLNFSSGLLDVLSKTILVLVFLLFLLLGSHQQRDRPLPEVWVKITNKVQRYILTKLAVSAVTGVVVGLMLWVIGVPLSGLFGFMAFVLNFIPSVGSIISTLLPVPIILVTPEATGLTVLLALALPGATQFTIGNIAEPKLLGNSLDLHPVAILTGLIFWGVLWGIVGMLLAAPIMAILKILMEQYELTRPVAQLMAGRMDELADAIAVDDTPTPAEPIAPVTIKERSAQ